MFALVLDSPFTTGTLNYYRRLFGIELPLVKYIKLALTLAIADEESENNGPTLFTPEALIGQVLHVEVSLTRSY